MPTALTVLAAASPGPLRYFLQSNLAGQAIVVLLVLISIVAWTVMVGKYLDLARLARLNRAFARKLDQAPHVLLMDTQRAAVSPYAMLVQGALSAWRRYGGGTPEARMGHVENALQRGVAEATVHYESKMVVLGSIVTGAPFLGLLGTVWGVMDAFGGIAAATGGASIQQLAPGVSGALLTTVAGLLVAIPSVFGYNYLLTQVKILVTELENFASSLADRIELEARETSYETEEE